MREIETENVIVRKPTKRNDPSEARRRLSVRAVI